MSNELTPEMVVKQFCQAYLAWIDGGAPEGTPFHRSEALCVNLRFVLDKSDLPQEFKNQCDAHLEAALPKSPWNDSFPFNKGIREWLAEGYAEQHYLNQQRTNWCKEYSS